MRATHLVPFFSYPETHEHSKDPTVLVQSWAQALSSSHSSASTHLLPSGRFPSGQKHMGPSLVGLHP